MSERARAPSESPFNSTSQGWGRGGAPGGLGEEQDLVESIPWEHGQ